MLSKNERLTTALFNRFFVSGKRYHTPHLQIIYHPHTDFHCAVVVGKKVSNSAVTRNYIRRRVYNTLYNIYKHSHATGVYIVVAKPTVTTANISEVTSELVVALQQFESHTT